MSKLLRPAWIVPRTSNALVVVHSAVTEHYSVTSDPRMAGQLVVRANVHNPDDEDIHMPSCVTKWSVWLVEASLLSGLAACGEDAAPKQFIVGSPVTVSGPSPFAECQADVDPDQPYWLDSEVEPFIVVNPNDSRHLAATWQQDRYFTPGCRGNMSAVSFDGGATWSSSVIPGLTLCSGGNSVRASDPWLAFGANGYLYSASLAFTEATVERLIYVNRSTDGGRTWDDPVLVAAGPGLNDKESMTADPTEDCSIYVTWSQLSPGGVGGRVLFSRTSDCGGSWRQPHEVYSSNPYGFDAQLVVLPSGELLVFFIEGSREDVDLPIYVSRSSDGGQSWSANPSIAVHARQATVVTPAQDMSLRTHRPGFDVALDRHDGSIYLVWEQIFDGSASPVQVAFASSPDGGVTWSAPVRIDRTPPSTVPALEQAFIPSVEVSDDGTVGVAYYNFQNDVVDEPPSSTDYWFIHCAPSGASCTEPQNWSDATRLTSHSFDYGRAPESLVGLSSISLFLGDYVGLAALGSDFFAFFSLTTEDDPADAVFVPIVGR